jgi:hypothetical protein
MKVELMKISDVKKNPENPRVIKGDKYKKLLQSIKDFPEMLEVRPLVVDENNIVLGGNMRLKACKEAGLEEVPVIKWSNLSDEKKKEFIVKDNVGYGEWDWDVLADWDFEMLEDWGLDVPDDADDKEEEVEGEVKFNAALDFESNYIVLKFDKDIDWIQAQSIFGLESGWNLGGNGKAYTKGVGRVMDGVDAILKIKESGYEG